MVQQCYLRIWDFNIFSPNAWRTISDMWGEGWVVDTTSEFFFFFFMLIAVLIFAVVYFLLYKVNYINVASIPYRRFKKKKFIEHRIKLDAFPGPEKMLKDLQERAAKQSKHVGKEKMPRPMDSAPLSASKIKKKVVSQSALVEEKQREAKLKEAVKGGEKQPSRFVDLETETKTKINAPVPLFTSTSSFEEQKKSVSDISSPSFTFSASSLKEDKVSTASNLSEASNEPSDMNGLFNPQEVSVPTIVSRVDMKYETLMLAEQTGLRIVQDLKIGYDIIDFAILAKDEVYLINFEPVGSEWVADETGFEDDEPLWFSESKYETSPVFKLNRAAKEYAKVLDEIMEELPEKIAVKKIFLIGGGAVLNYEDIKTTWEEMGVATYRLSTGRPVEIPELFAFLKALSSKGANSEEITDMIYTAFVAAEP